MVPGRLAALVRRLLLLLRVRRQAHLPPEGLVCLELPLGLVCLAVLAALPVLSLPGLHHRHLILAVLEFPAALDRLAGLALLSLHPRLAVLVYLSRQLVPALLAALELRLHRWRQ